jgi:cell division protein FtsI (penicillin-binding protein 3)
MHLSRRRLLMLFAFLTTWTTAVVGRLVQIQLVRHQEYVVRAARQHDRTLELTPMRGAIVDRRGRILAESITADSIYADPQAIVDPHAAAKALASVRELGVAAPELERRLRGRGEFAWIARQVMPDVAARVRNLHLAGIYALEEHRRSYPKGTLAASVLGYVSVDGEGLAGIEHSFDSYVRGRSGKVTLLRDARRGMYLVGGEGSNAPADGENVVLTIDEVIQYLAEEALSKAVTKWGAVGGSAVVMDPSDGSILAMASYPGFDPNRFRDFPPASWKNRVVQDLYEPGSTFKIVTASAALEEGIVTPSQILDCGPGYIEIANVRIREHGGNAYGMIPFEDVMVHSSNVGMIRVALALGRKTLYRYIREFGFGEQTGITLPGEAVGIVRPPERWSQLSNAVMAIGQEIAATPLQVLRAGAIIANGGNSVEPRLVDRIVDSTGKTIYRPPVSPPRRVISERTAAVLNEILKQVVARGTGRDAALDEHVAAGKTGTAQKAGRGGYLPDKYIASFVGYVPADRPRLAILVVVDEPKGVHYGGTVAAPAFREIAEGALRYLRVAPSVPGRVITMGRVQLATFSERGRSLRSPAPAPMTGNAVTPDLRGLDARQAVALASASGFEVTARGGGVVVQQSPLPGEIAGNRTIGIILDEGGSSR